MTPETPARLPLLLAAAFLLVAPTAGASGGARPGDEGFLSWKDGVLPVLPGGYVFVGWDPDLAETHPVDRVKPIHPVCVRAGTDLHVNRSSDECWRDEEASDRVSTPAKLVPGEIVVGAIIFGRAHCIATVGDDGQVHHPCCAFETPREVVCYVPSKAAHATLP